MFTIKEWRRVRNISQEDLADKLGVVTNTIRNWEADSSVIPIGKCIKMAEIFGVQLSDIIFLPQE